MSKHENPMQFFKGSKLGINLKPHAVERLLLTLNTVLEHEKRINDAMEYTFGESTDEYEIEAIYDVEACLRNAYDEKEKLQLAASCALTDDIQLSLDRFCTLSSQTKAEALRMALGRVVAEDY